MTPEGYLAKDGYKFFPPEQQEEAEQKLQETQQKFGWAIPDGLGHYFYEIERDFNVDKSLREEAKRLSLKYYNAFLNNVKWDEQQFADEMSAFKDRIDSDKKIGWDAGNEGKSPKSLDAFLNKEKSAASVFKKEEAPVPAKESTDDLMGAIDSIKEDIEDTTKEIEDARKVAREKINKIREEILDLKESKGKEGTIMDLEADIKEIEDILKDDLDGLKLDLDRHVKALKEEVKKLGDLDAKAPENKKTLLSYLDAAIKTLNGLNKLSYVKYDFVRGSYKTISLSSFL